MNPPGVHQPPVEPWTPRCAEPAAHTAMGSSAILFLCCALAGAAAGQGQPCVVDEAGTRGDCQCRSIRRCPEQWQIARTARPNTPAASRLRQLVSKCRRSAAGRLQICCQNEVTRPRVTLPVEPQCGLQFSPRVIGGENATIGEFPWQVSIQYTVTPGGPLEHRCGGTLITSRHVLTAAHCVTFLATAATPDLTPVAVVLGELNFDGEVDCLVDFPDVCADRPETVEIDAIFAHKDFENIRALALPFDIAVLRLAREVAITDFIRPICLLTDLSVLRGRRSDLSSGQNGFVAGWGQSVVNSERRFTPVLQQGRLPIQEVSECERVYGQKLPGRICAGAGPNSTDTCRGDSGGPLMTTVKAGSFWYQTGVSSFGTRECGNVAGYTRVFDYADWIVEQINK